VWRDARDREATERILVPIVTALASAVLARLYPEGAAAAGLTIHEEEKT
jgi:hypothetical protein